MPSLDLASFADGAVRVSVTYSASNHRVTSATVVNTSTAPCAISVTAPGGAMFTRSFNPGTTTVNLPSGITYDPALDTDLQAPANFTFSAGWPA